MEMIGFNRLLVCRVQRRSVCVGALKGALSGSAGQAGGISKWKQFQPVLVTHTRTVSLSSTDAHG